MYEEALAWFFNNSQSALGARSAFNVGGSTGGVRIFDPSDFAIKAASKWRDINTAYVLLEAHDQEILYRSTFWKKCPKESARLGRWAYLCEYLFPEEFKKPRAKEKVISGAELQFKRSLRRFAVEFERV